MSTDETRAIRCAWAGTEGIYLDYHDREWGPPRRLRYKALRKTLPRGFPVRPLLADHPAQAREFPRRVPWLRDREGRGHGRGRHRASAAGRRHHPPSRQDRLDHRQCQAGAGNPGRVRLARGLFLGFRTQARGAAGAADPGRARDHGRNRGLARAEQGSAQARLRFRRANHLLCVHAGDGAGQRPCRGVLLPDEVEAERERLARPWRGKVARLRPQ